MQEFAISSLKECAVSSLLTRSSGYHRPLLCLVLKFASTSYKVWACGSLLARNSGHCRCLLFVQELACSRLKVDTVSTLITRNGQLDLSMEKFTLPTFRYGQSFPLLQRIVDFADFAWKNLHLFAFQNGQASPLVHGIGSAAGSGVA